MRTYFNIRYEFDQQLIGTLIAQQINKPADYICVADGVVLNLAHRHSEYLEVVNGGLFSICDSSYVPLYIKWIYGEKYRQYSGSQIFMDVVRSKKYRMMFMGASKETLHALKANLANLDSRIEEMVFWELPFKAVEDFDYPAIAQCIERDGADIIWIALGAPKQEIFMSRLKPHLKRGVMIAVGAVFNFYSGLDIKRAPQWMVRHHLEFIYRIAQEPKKQIKRCTQIVMTLPTILFKEWLGRERHH
jgi:N-acetylglucosaminyldiphosphoundecaprenol N-acetyl-beta-D-mannosaminyltransferase